ncbi:MAG TPA: HDOD domain-containing protein [Bryobacteraceae bacterium]|nr:HDOD domain-containing protein [Bryobacteraceae bacterium]
MLELQTEPVQTGPVKQTPWALDELPPFPWVAQRLMATVSKEDVDIHEVGKLIAAEPVFATRVLQLANSPLFALQRQVRTISHAIILLGLDRVKAITFTRALEDFVTPALKIKALRACWQNCLATALLSEKLARAARMDADFAYVAGLLRDIGRLALLVKYPEPYSNLLAVSGEQQFDLLMMERELFDIDHCQAGAWLLQQLPFPPELADIITNHHEQLDHDSFRMLHLVQCADRLADALGFGVLPDAQPSSIDDALEHVPEAARARLGADYEQWKADVTARLQAWR